MAAKVQHPFSPGSRVPTPDVDYRGITPHNLHWAHTSMSWSQTTNYPFPERGSGGLQLIPSGALQHLPPDGSTYTVWIHDLNLITDIPGMHQLNTTLTIMRIFTSTSTPASPQQPEPTMLHSEGCNFTNDPINYHTNHFCIETFNKTQSMHSFR